VRSFRIADYDTDHNLVDAQVRELLAVIKQTTQKFDVESFNLRKLNELEFRKDYQIEISKRSAALKNLIDSEDINRACENTEENVKTSTIQRVNLCELKQHKPWFAEEYSLF